MVELDMEFYLGNLCVDINLWSRSLKKFRKITALIDTGAHTTHIDTDVLKRLGYDLKDAEKSYISTVGSSNMQINNTVIDNIQLGELELGSILVNFSELSDVRSLVILGMNIIKEFNVTLDFKNMKMLLEPNFDINAKIPVENFSRYNSRFGMWNIRGV